LISGHVVHEPSGAMRSASDEPIALRACEHRLHGREPVSLRIPARSMLTHRPQVVSDFRMGVPCGNDPLWQRVPIDLDGDPVAQVKLAMAQRGGAVTPVQCDVLPPSPPPRAAVVEYRGDHWSITGWTDDLATTAYAAAIDIGTTTVALLLVDLATGNMVSRASAFNRQIHLGDDVLTRINLCMTEPTMLAELQEAVVVRTIAPLLKEALQHANARHDQVACLSIAGNTTMLHLLAGVDPASIGVAPFTPTFLDYRHETAASIKLPDVLPQTSVHLLPGAAGYIGADLTAGVVSSGMLYREETCLLVDVGTNGEIILKHGPQLYGCATAAGPAFEGSRLNSGMRAGDGAVSHIRITANPLAIETQVIGELKPVGMCGSAYVDFLAQARAANVVGETGRFDETIPEDRLTKTRYGKGFIVAPGLGKEPVAVAEVDIAALLQAKAAIAAGILTLLQKAGLGPADVDTLYLAGGFGMHLNIANTIACGMLPGFTAAQVQLVGNTSLGGAYMAALDSSVIDELSRVRRQLQIVELNLEPEFEGRYIDELRLPDPPTA
jgi:uncharacterized 2Fe-2S/4Fe-4S cluster protein (DUF4445 family)